MGERKRVGIVFNTGHNWTGGRSYIINLVQSLKLLPAQERPFVTVYTESREDFEALKAESGWDEIAFCQIQNIPPGIFARAINKLSRAIIKRDLLYPSVSSKEDIIFPNPHGRFFQANQKQLFWIPDFQEKYYPNFFSEEELRARNERVLQLIKENQPVVFSSQSSKNDFLKFYPEGSGCKTFVLPFAVFIPSFEMNTETVKEKYGITGRYFISPNQFWVHKNHSVVIEAVELLKKENFTCTVLFTGKEYDHRKPEYTAELKKQVIDKGLTDNIKFLGFIDKQDQWALIAGADAVIQPSLFEGWSTVVEEAKALNKWVIASDIDTHREQLTVGGSFFRPDDAGALKEAMASLIKEGAKRVDLDYNLIKQQFSGSFNAIISSFFSTN